MTLAHDARRVRSHRDRHDRCCIYDDALDTEVGFRVLSYLHVEDVNPGFATAARLGKARKAGAR